MTSNVTTSTQASISTSELIAQINSVSNHISFFYLIVIIPFGLVTNCLSIYIYLRPNLNKNTNTGVLYMCLSVMNIISLLNYALIVRSNTLFGYTVSLSCGLADYIRRNIFNSTSWVQAFISFDRFVCIFFPTKGKLLSKKITLLAFMVVILATIFITNVTNLIAFEVVAVRFNNNTNVTTTTQSCDQTKAMSLLTDFIAILMRVYIPFFIMIIFNILIIKRLYDSKKG